MVGAMPGYVVILEDDVARISAMRLSLATLLPQYECVVFDNASEMIA
jgi:hypothetical protein